VHYLFEEDGSPTPAPTTASECPVGKMKFAVVVKNDSAMLTRRPSGFIVPDMGVLLTRLERAMRTIRCTGYKICLPDDYYSLTISDSHGDGMRNSYGR
jgi:hypothetical protein